MMFHGSDEPSCPECGGRPVGVGWFLDRLRVRCRSCGHAYALTHSQMMREVETLAEILDHDPPSAA